MEPAEPASQGNGPGIVGEVKAGLTESFRRGSGTSVDDALTNITAALTAVLIDKAKELLDRNLPGFADRYEQVAHPGDAPTSDAGAGRPGGATPAGRTPYSTGEPAFTPADATTMSDASAAGTGREAGARDPSAERGSG